MMLRNILYTPEDRKHRKYINKYLMLQISDGKCSNIFPHLYSPSYWTVS